MALKYTEDPQVESDDDDVIIGTMSMEEEKKRLISDYRKLSRQWAKFNCKDDQNQSLKIIEMESAPNLLTKNDILPPIIPKSVSSPDLSPDAKAVSICDFQAYKEKGFQSQKDTSYVAPENEETCLQGDVAYLDIGPPLRNNCKLAMPGTLNNESTLEIHEHFPQEQLHLCTPEKSTQSQENKNNLVRENQEASNLQEDIQNLEIVAISPLHNDCLSDIVGPSNNSKFLTPLMESKLAVLGTSNNDIFFTPISKSMIAVPGTSNCDIFLTPLSELQTITRKSMSRNKQKYQNMISPIATYIKKSPHVPLLRDICPRKPLPQVSRIPVKCLRPNKGTKECLRPNKDNTECLRPNKSNNECLRPNKGNKENIKGDKQEKFELPTVCYKSAKETKMIHIPDVGKMPQNQWAKRVESSIPKVTVIKHQHREVNSGEKPLLKNQDDSFADLSLRQADLSICTKKSAFKKL